MYKKLLTRTNLFLLIILAIASFMRLYKIADYLTFLGDEGRDVLVVYNILHGHFTLLGPTSSVGGFFLGPIYYYFMAPFLWLFNYSPVGPAVMIAIVGIITTWFVYYVGSKFFNPTAGIIAAALFAINPLVILYSRSSWNPNLMPLATLLMLFVLYEAVRRNSWKLYLLTGFLYGIVMQLHYIEVFVGPMMVVYFLLGNLYKPDGKNYIFFHPRMLVKQALFVLAGFIIGWSPFLIFEARHGFNNFRAIFNFVFHAKDSGNGVGIDATFLSSMLDIFHRIFGRLILYMPTPDMYHVYASWELQAWNIAAWIVGIASMFFLIYTVRVYWRNRDKCLQYMLLFFWLFMGILFFGFYKKNIYDYYFEFLFPVPFLLFGAVVAFFLQKKFSKLIMYMVLIGIVGVNLLGIPFRYPGNQQLQQTETISRFVLNKTNNQPFNFALITGGNSDHAYRYFFTIWGHPPTTIQYPGVDPQRTSVTGQLLVICEQNPCEPLGNSLWEIAGFGRADIVGSWDVSVVKVYKLVHYSALENSKNQSASNK